MTCNMVLTAIAEINYQVLHNNVEAWAVTLYISRVFDRVWHSGLFPKLQGYRI